MAEGKEPAPQDGLPPNIDEECASWDWARAAGVSAQELRKALQSSMRAAPEGADGDSGKAGQ
jgi:hypothetical protein